MSLSFTLTPSELYYEGAGSAADAGVAYPVSLGGVPYALDTYQTEFSHSSVELLRPSTDITNNVGAQTLNPNAYWRRTFESWHVGAGQTHFDRHEESSPHRFRTSQGVDVWDRYQMSLLNDTDSKYASADTNIRLVVVGSNLYITDGNLLRFTTDITVDAPSTTNVTGVHANDITSIASDGFNVLTAHGAGGLYKTTRGAATTASNITGTVTHVSYGKGRWIATHNNALYDITTLVAGGGALPAAHYTQPNTDFTWNSFAEGPTAFYVGGYSGDKSLIYRLGMREDGTGLNQPVVAGFLPDGELIHSMQGYLGFVLIGTSLGVRIGIVGGNGDLTIGALIPTDDPVLCFEGQDKFVWFGWSNLAGDVDQSGLGRIDLETFSNSDSLAPAYASDLMASSAAVGETTSVVTFQGLRVFSVNGTTGSVWAEDPDVLVPSGFVETGLFDYGLTDTKLSLYVDVSFVEAGGSTTVQMGLNRQPFVTLATLTDSPSPIGTGEARAEEFEIRVELARDSVDEAVGPTLRSFTVRALPASPNAEVIVVPLLIGPNAQQLNGFAHECDSFEQRDNVVSLCASKEVVLYREGAQSWSVVVDAYQLDVKDVFFNADEELGINGTCLTRLKVVV